MRYLRPIHSLSINHGDSLAENKRLVGNYNALTSFTPSCVQNRGHYGCSTRLLIPNGMESTLRGNCMLRETRYEVGPDGLLSITTILAQVVTNCRYLKGCSCSGINHTAPQGSILGTDFPVLTSMLKLVRVFLRVSLKRFYCPPSDRLP